MSDERRNFLRRSTDARATLETLTGESVDERVRLINLSIDGARIASDADLTAGERYRMRLDNTDTWFEISVQERIGAEFRCKIETPWNDLHDVIRQSDDLTLLVLESSESEEDSR